MENQLEIKGLKINYSESGRKDGKPVIILHGWGCNFSTVKSIAECLEDGMRIFSIDLPGHGKSQEPDDVWSTFDFSDFLKEFIKHHSLSNPSLIGHSFGGRVSIAYASKHPVDKLVLIDSAGIKPKRSLKYYYKVYSYKLLKKIVKALFKEEKADKYINKALNKKASADYLSSSPRMRAVMSKCVNEDLTKFLPEINASTLLIWGEKDTATPLTDAKKMERSIKDSGLVSFANCGHYSFLDNPYQFKAVLRSFFDKELKEATQKARSY